MAKPRALPQYRIFTELERPSRDVVERFAKYSTAPISDSLHKRQTLPYYIKSVHQPAKSFAGPALTVYNPTGDQLINLKAIEIARPGDVIVVAGCSTASSSIMGGVMAWMAHANQVAGIVTDGLVRDFKQIRDSGLAIHARGLTPLAPTNDVPPGDLNCPVSIGDAIIHPGDLVVADADGVVVVPLDLLDSVSRVVEETEVRDDKWIEDIKRTNSIDEILAWCAVDKTIDAERRSAVRGGLYHKRS